MRRNNKQLYESIMKDVAKIIKKHLNENTDKDVIKKFKLISFVEEHSEECKTLVRNCTKELRENLNITTIDDINKNPREVRNVLDKWSKKIFKCTFFNLNKKYVDGLSDDLLNYCLKFIDKNIINDTEDNWAPMYNK